MPKKASSHRLPMIRQKKRLAASQWMGSKEERRIYKSVRWQKLRARVAREEPLCRDPYGWHAEDHRIIPTAEVDHIVPLRVDKGLAYVRSNLQGLCKLCHVHKTQDDQARYPAKKSVYG